MNLADGIDILDFMNKTKTCSQALPQNSGIAHSWIPAAYVEGLVSVIVPTHNRADLIEQTLQSVFAQTYESIEVLVVDDGSTDDTDKLVLQVSQQANAAGRLSYIRQDQSGAQVARNRGCRQSRGEFIQFLDSDDTLSPQKISLQVEAMRRENCAVAYGPWRCMYGSGLAAGRNTTRLGRRIQTCAMPDERSMLEGYISTTWCCPPHSYLFRRSAVQKIGPWDEQLKRRQDTDYMARMLLHNPHFVFVPDADVFYRRHGNEHIGRSSNFARHFPSLIGLIEKQWQFIRDLQSYERFRAAQLKALAMLCDESWVVGHGRFADDCLEMARKLYGEDGVSGVQALRSSWRGRMARRYLSHPLRRVAGEYYSQRLRDLCLGRAA